MTGARRAWIALVCQGLFCLGLFWPAGAAFADNRPPVAADDQVKVTGLAFVVVDVLANDSDPDGDLLTVTLPPGGASVSNLGSGLIKFQPRACLQQPHVVTYQVEDGQGGSATANLTLAPGGCQDNRPPSANPDVGETTREEITSVPVLANDTDPDGDVLTIDRVEGELHGTAWISADRQRVLFQPAAGYSGTDAGVRYWASDGYGGESDAWVFISVSDVPPGQGLIDNVFTTERDKVLAVTSSDLVDDDIPFGHVFLTAFSTQGDRVEVLWPPSGDARILFFPPAGFTGTRLFQYSAESPPPNPTIGTADVNLDVTTPVGSMQAADDLHLRTVRDGCLVLDTRALVANDTYSGQELPVVSHLTDPFLGSMTLVAGSGDRLYDYTPPSGATGFDMLQYQALDSLPDSSNFDVATVLIEVQEPTARGAGVPVAQPDWAVSTGNQQVIIPVLENDYDPDCTALTVEYHTGSTTLGTITRVGSTQLRFSPHAGAVGTTTFQYQVRDAAGKTAVGTVTVEVEGAIYPPCPQLSYRSCSELSTCIVDAVGSRARTSPVGLCQGPLWSFANADHWLALEGVSPAASNPHAGSQDWIRPDVVIVNNEVVEAIYPMAEEYAQPGLMRADLTLYEHDPNVSGASLTATSGRWVPVGGTTTEWTIGHHCVNSVCSFWPEGNWLDGVVDRFEWFFDGLRHTTGCNGLQCGLDVPDPDLVTTGMSSVDHVYTSLGAGASFEVLMLAYVFDRPNPVPVTLSGTIPIPPPAPPSGLAASNAVCAASGPLLTWVDQSHTEDGFRIYRGVNGAPPVAVDEVAEDETDYQDFYTGPRSDALTYQLVAFNDGGESTVAEVVGRPTPADCGTAAAAPLAPSDLAADAPSSGVRLHWRDNSAQEAGFRIYRREGAGAFVLRGTVGTDAETYYDAPVDPNGSYTYRVAAFNALGETAAALDLAVTVPDFLFADSFESGDTGAWTQAVGNVSGSSQAELVQAAAAPLEVLTLGASQTLLRPSDLHAASYRRGGVELAWQDNATSEAGFRVLRKEKGQPYAEIAVLPPDSTTYFDAPVEPGEKVRYRVIAFDAEDKKRKSGVLRVKVPKDVFQDSFETGDLRAWAGAVDPEGRLSGSFAAGLFGNRGLAVSLEDSSGTVVPAYAFEASPQEEPRLRARVLLDARRFTPPPGVAEGQPFVTFFRGMSETGVERFSLRLLKAAGGVAVDAVLQAADGSTWPTAPAPVDGRVTQIEIDWDARSSAGTGTGRFRLWLDGRRQDQLEGWAGADPLSSGVNVGSIQLGAVELAPGGAGFLALDEVNLRRGGGKIRRRHLAGHLMTEGFELRETYGWKTFTQGGGVHLVPAALEGSQALEVTVSSPGAEAYLEKELYHRERHLLASLLVDATALSLPQDETVTLFTALDAAGEAGLVLRLKQTAEGLKAVARTRDGTGWSSQRLELPNGPARIEVEWRSAAGPTTADGSLALRVTDESADETDTKLLEGVATGGERLKTLRLGLTEPAPAGTSGSYRIDDLEVWR